MIDLSRSADLYLEEEIAIQEISKALKQSALALVIGAGVSKSASSAFATWDQLVEKCCLEKGIPFNDARRTSNDYLLQLMNDIEKSMRKEQYLDLVKEKLYDGVEYNNGAMQKNLLISLGSIVMNSVRGNNSGVVINYNFDDLLEWYLEYHGHKIQIVSEPSSIITGSDVTIYHPHGFLPLTEKYDAFESQDIVFSQRSYLTAHTRQNLPMNELQRAILSSKVALIVGMSGDDSHVLHLCHYAYQDIVCRRRLIGFNIFVKSGDEESDNEKVKKWLDCGLASIFLDSYDDLPEKLLEICRNAAELS